MIINKPGTSHLVDYGDGSLYVSITVDHLSSLDAVKAVTDLELAHVVVGLLTSEQARSLTISQREVDLERWLLKNGPIALKNARKGDEVVRNYLIANGEGHQLTPNGQLILPTSILQSST